MNGLSVSRKPRRMGIERFKALSTSEKFDAILRGTQPAGLEERIDFESVLDELCDNDDAEW